MNSQLTDELIETLRGIKDGKKWEHRCMDNYPWSHPNEKGLWDVLKLGHQIRLKPFVPEPPEGYRLLTEEECQYQWVQGGKYWNGTLWKHLEGDTGCKATTGEHIAVPIEPPAPQYVPWTFETGPRDRLVWVHKKGYFTDRLIIAWRDNGVEIANWINDNSSVVSYQTLLDEWLLPKNAPCGTLKQ